MVLPDSDMAGALGWTSKAVAAATVVGVLVAGAAPPAVAGESWQQQVAAGQAEEPGETAVELKQRTVDRLVLALWVTGIKKYSVHYGKSSSQRGRHRPWE